ncbi:hypothetical protein MTR_1g114570 [Medicago truncatula]|uniref:Uncharacterized protein n=1 Tax=Medicago truncatula TaxID=3880 RepID=G7IEA7_MEDTR|nr:hypothetical protein MTR_1g114570 [Medicago truncatula]
MLFRLFDCWSIIHHTKPPIPNFFLFLHLLPSTTSSYHHFLIQKIQKNSTFHVSTYENSTQQIKLRFLIKMLNPKTSTTTSLKKPKKYKKQRKWR